MDTLTDKMEQLEEKIRELLGELKRLREEKESLEVKLLALDQEMAALRGKITELEKRKAGDPPDSEYLQRLETERDQIRIKISEMLMELEKIKEME